MDQRMKRKAVIIIIIAALGLLVWFSHVHEFLTLGKLKEHRYLLQRFVAGHYYLSVALFVAFYISTAFFVPGAILSTVAGGYLFGVPMGTIYVNIAAITGATLAFLSSRFLIGDWIQKRYRDQLKRFNEEVEKYGHNFLFAMRMVPVLPFFLTNYLAGITTISLKKFVIATALGMLPGSLVYTFAGRQLAGIERLEDIFSPKLLTSFLLLALFSLLPSIKNWIDLWKKKG